MFDKMCGAKMRLVFRLSYDTCCSVLQCVAVCCSVLQCVAVCCKTLQCVACGCERESEKRNARVCARRAREKEGERERERERDKTERE